jgi:hypothetical protein
LSLSGSAHGPARAQPFCTSSATLGRQGRKPHGRRVEILDCRAAASSRDHGLPSPCIERVQICFHAASESHAAWQQTPLAHSSGLARLLAPSLPRSLSPLSLSPSLPHSSPTFPRSVAPSLRVTPTLQVPLFPHSFASSFPRSFIPSLPHSLVPSFPRFLIPSFPRAPRAPRAGRTRGRCTARMRRG